MRTLVGAMTIVACLGGLTLIAVSARAQTSSGIVCFDEKDHGNGCKNCTGASCLPCQGGCPGASVECLNLTTCDANAPVHKDITTQMRPCWVEYNCVPEDPGTECGANNPCVRSMFPTASSTAKFARQECSGDCPKE